MNSFKTYLPLLYPLTQGKLLLYLRGQALHIALVTDTGELYRHIIDDIDEFKETYGYAFYDKFTGKKYKAFVHGITPAGHCGYLPTQISFERVRIKRFPSAIAGVARMASPISFLAKTLYSSESSSTTTTPFSPAI